MFTAIKKYRYSLIVVCVMAVYAILFTVLCALRYRSYFAESWEDLAFYNQMIWNIAHGNGPYCSITNTIFHQHPALILYPMALLYVIVPHITMLFATVSIAFASGALPVYWIAKKILGSARYGVACVLVYVLFPPLHALNLSDFRPLILSVPILLWAFYFFEEKKLGWFVVSALLAISCYETVSFVVFFFGVYALVKERERQWIVIPMVIGCVSFAVLVFVVIPWLGFADWLQYIYLGDYGLGFVPKGEWHCFDMIVYFMSHPFVLLQRICSVRMLWFAARVSGLPFFLMPLFAPAALLVAIPVYLQIMLLPDILGCDYIHQYAPIVPGVIVAGIYGCRRCFIFFDACGWTNIRPYVMACVIVPVLVANAGDTRLGLIDEPIVDTRFEHARNLFDPVFYTLDEQDVIADALIAKIPEDAVVAASGDILPQLSHRKYVHEFQFIGGTYFRDKKEVPGIDAYRAIEYVLLRTVRMEHGAGSNSFDNSRSREEVRWLCDAGMFSVVAEEGDFILLKNRRAR